MSFAFPSFPVAQLCTIKVETANVLGNLVYVNTRQTTFRKQPLERTDQGWLYAVSVLDFQQSEARGLAQLDADTARLRQDLLIETDESGGLLRVGNKAALRRTWESLEPELRSKYRHSKEISPAMVAGVGQVLHGDGYLEDVLRRGYEYGTLFPALYGQPHTAAPLPGRPRIIARFLGNLDLPLLTTTRQQVSVPADVRLGLLVEGQVDAEAYPAAEARQALRTMTDRYDLDTTLRLQHLESYEFDQNAELRHGAQFTVFGVDGVFMSKTLCTLTAQAA